MVFNSTWTENQLGHTDSTRYYYAERWHRIRRTLYNVYQLTSSIQVFIYPLLQTFMQRISAQLLLSVSSPSRCTVCLLPNCPTASTVCTDPAPLLSMKCEIRSLGSHLVSGMTKNEMSAKIVTMHMMTGASVRWH